MATVTEIPKTWRADVCDILDFHRDCIDVSLRAVEYWDALFPNSSVGGYNFQLYARMSEALKVDGVVGTKIPRIGNDIGEIWEFRFAVDDKNLYGKISLRLMNKHGMKSVFIYSAHLEEKPYL